MVIAFHSKDSLLLDFQRKEIPFAIDRLKRFPTLYALLDGFKDYDKLDYKESNNIIFVTCRRLPNGGNEIGYPSLLWELEQGIEDFKVASWKSEIRNDFISRLRDYDFYTSEEALHEIVIPYRLGQLIGLDKVTTHAPLKNGKNSDFVVTPAGRRIFMELTSARERVPDKKVLVAFRSLAKHLGDKCTSKNYSVTVYVDTARLPKENGHISSELSSQFLANCSDNLHLEQLAGTNCYIDLRHDYRWIDDRKTLGNLMGTEYEFSIPPEMAEMIKTRPEIAQWASEAELHTMSASPFLAVSYISESNGDMVEIHSDEFSPSDSWRARECSLHRQLGDKITKKINQQQYEIGEPVIIIIKEDTSDKMQFDDDLEQQTGINNTVKAAMNNSPWLSGLVLYHRSLQDGRYVPNDGADPSVVLTKQELETMKIPLLE